MFRRSKKSAVLDKTNNISGSASDLAAKAADVAQQAADRAAVLAQTAFVAAAPRMRKARQKGEPALRLGLSRGAGRASSVLADTADWLAEAEKTQKALGKKAEKKRFRKLKGLVLISALLGGIVAAVKSPFGAKLRDKITGGPYPDELEEPEGITLSVDQSATKNEPVVKATADNNGVGVAKAKEPADN